MSLNIPVSAFVNTVTTDLAFLIALFLFHVVFQEKTWSAQIVLCPKKQIQAVLSVQQ